MSDGPVLPPFPPPVGASTRSTWGCRKKWPSGTRRTRTRPPRAVPSRRTNLWCEIGVVGAWGERDPPARPHNEWLQLSGLRVCWRWGGAGRAAAGGCPRVATRTRVVSQHGGGSRGLTAKPWPVLGSEGLQCCSAGSEPRGGAARPWLAAGRRGWSRGGSAGAELHLTRR